MLVSHPKILWVSPTPKRRGQIRFACAPAWGFYVLCNPPQHRLRPLPICRLQPHLALSSFTSKSHLSPCRTSSFQQLSCYSCRLYSILKESNKIRKARCPATLEWAAAARGTRSPKKSSTKKYCNPAIIPD